MARTRSARGTAASADEKVAAPSKSSASTYALPPPTDNPPKLFVLPKTASPSARIVTLQNPRNDKPTRYLVCPEAGFFEFTRISPPKSAPRSWLIQPSPSIPQPATTSSPQTASQLPTQTVESPALHLATPFDPLFLLLPALLPPSLGSANTKAGRTETPKRPFLSFEDHLDALPDPSRHLAELLSSSPSSSAPSELPSSGSTPAVHALLESRLAAVCDTVDAGGETMYRASEAKLVREVWGKARRMAEGLPGSMEEQFVRKVLEAPVVGVSRASVVAAGSGEMGEEGVGEGGESQVSSASSSSVDTAVSGASSGSGSGSEVSAASTAATSVAEGETDGVVSAMTAPEEVVRLQRLRVAFDFICSRYVAPPIAETLKAGLAKATDLVDFTPLDEYLAKLAKLRQEAAAARSTDYSRKRGNDEEADERAEKRRKKEAEEKAKKANQSRGVRELMKVNTSGMKKLSEFFKKT
ncbi:hypothetical protein VTK26DRAFT_4800 [Humicola hyalothermophila]